MTNAEIAAKIRDALYEIESGSPRGVDEAERMLNALVDELEGKTDA